MNVTLKYELQDGEARIEEILESMSIEDMVELLSGEDFWSIAAQPKYGIGKLRVTDGPNGARGSGSSAEGDTSAAFPVGIALGATWDADLVSEVAQAIAEETKSKGAQVCLAPTVNVHRTVTNGRNFECYSEDPELSSALTCAYISGLQSEGIASTVKHFAGNESEIERTTINSIIDERSLREVYLRPFEDAVKQAGTWGIMSSYNKLNGTYAAESDWLLTTVLRDQWGYDGIVVSDWFGTRSTAPTINAGVDLEMPGPTRDRGSKLLSALEKGSVSENTLRERSRAMLRFMSRVGVLDEMPPYKEVSDDKPEHRSLIRKAAAAGMVLLKNENVLPLSPNGKKIAVIGPNAKIAQIMGGGSSQLNPHHRISPWDGLVEQFGEDLLSYATGCQNHRWEPIVRGDIKIEYFAHNDLHGEVLETAHLEASVDYLFPKPVEGKIAINDFSARLQMSFVPDHTGTYSFGLHTAGRGKLKIDQKTVVDAWTEWTRGRTFFEEGCDEITGEIDLVAGKTYEVLLEFQTVTAANLLNPGFRFGVSQPLGDKAIEQAVACARNADTAVLFVGRSGEWDTEGSDLEHITLPGRQNELIDAVAEVNSNTLVVLQTGGPVEMPWLGKVRAILQAWYPGQELGHAIADVLTGNSEPTGRLPQTFPKKWSDNPTYSDNPEIYPGENGAVKYTEGVFIGYRHYEKNGIEPLFPFGFGLGYTSFDLSELKISEHGQNVQVMIDVENTGLRRGTTVVQVYVGDDRCSVRRPKKELKAFKKITLDAGEKTTASVMLEPRDFAFFDIKSECWRVEEGSFTVSAGLSVSDIRSVKTLQRRAEELPV